ncbi:hypothetical protein ZWY2020_001661 [Hordeum vulgare]|nr:hypothetical protein ZWY2020_037679 [Hordeum vulgare]KAI4970747.1 hypothetical protein ZWY2020_001661 [Hordeum vulgare]
MDLVVVSEEPNPNSEAAAAHSRPEPPPLRCPSMVLHTVPRSCFTHSACPRAGLGPPSSPLPPSFGPSGAAPPTTTRSLEVGGGLGEWGW